MSIDQAITFVLFAIVAAGTPGPSNLLLTSTGARLGIRRGLPCLLGVTAGMGLMMFLAALGLGTLVVGHPIVMRVLKWGGIAYLLWLSWKVVTAGHSDAASATRGGGFWGAAGFQWVNPKSWLVSVSAVGTYVQPETTNTFVQAVTLGSLFTLAAVPSCFVWLACGATIQHVLRTERSARMFNVTMGLLLAGSIMLLVR